MNTNQSDTTAITNDNDSSVILLLGASKQRNRLEGFDCISVVVGHRD